MKQDAPTDSGNILIYILGAIFLMGLLVVVARGAGAPGSGIDGENLIIRVTEVQKYGAELEEAVRYVLRNGYSEVDIRFAHPNAPSTYGLITDVPARQVFDPQGGAAEYRDPPDGIQTTLTQWHFSGSNRVGDVGSDSASARSADLVAILQNVTRDFCVAVNDKSNVVNPAGDPPQDSGSADVSTVFTGTFAATQLIEDAGGELSEHHEGCFEGGGTPAAGTYHYYRVLLAR